MNSAITWALKENDQQSETSSHISRSIMTSLDTQKKTTSLWNNKQTIVIHIATTVMTVLYIENLYTLLYIVLSVDRKSFRVSTVKQSAVINNIKACYCGDGVIQECCE